MELAHGYLRRLPLPTLERLYADSASLHAVLRSLPALAQQCVARMVCLGDRTVSRNEALAWVGTSNAAKRRLAQALDTLLSLKLLVRMQEGIRLCDVTRDTLIALMCANMQLEANVPEDCDSLNKWEYLLLFLAAGGKAGTAPSEALVSVLVRNGLFKLSEDNNFSSASSGSGIEHEQHSGKLTMTGFNFLLEDTQRQLWQLCISYAEACGAPPDELLALLFGLATGQTIQLDALSDQQLLVLPDFEEVGLALVNHGENVVHSTRLVQLLVSQATHAVASNLRVEPNFKLCVLGESVLEVQLASLFANVEYRLPELAVMTITRVSIDKALKSGISAEQIVHFLKHRSPTTSDDKSTVPDNVIDQILVWGKQSQRLSMCPAVYYDQFETVPLFKEAANYSQGIEAELWSDSKKQLLVLKAECHPQVKQHVIDFKANDPDTQALYV